MKLKVMYVHQQLIKVYVLKFGEIVIGVILQVNVQTLTNHVVLRLLTPLIVIVQLLHVHGAMHIVLRTVAKQMQLSVVLRIHVTYAKIGALTKQYRVVMDIHRANVLMIVIGVNSQVNVF